MMMTERSISGLAPQTRAQAQALECWPWDITSDGSIDPRHALDVTGNNPYPSPARGAAIPFRGLASRTWPA